jgi:hypothetical protein
MGGKMIATIKWWGSNNVAMVQLVKPRPAPPWWQQQHHWGVESSREVRKAVKAVHFMQL